MESHKWNENDIRSTTQHDSSIRDVNLPVEPCHLWLHRLGEQDLSPRAEELRGKLRTDLLVDKHDPDFSEKFIETGRQHGFVVVVNDEVRSEKFRQNYDVLSEVFSQKRTWLEQLGSPGLGKDDGYIPPETEISVSARAGDYQANVFQFIHRVASEKNTEIGDVVGEKLRHATANILEVLYAEACDVSRGMARGLEKKGFLSPEGTPVPEDYFIQLMEDEVGRKSDLSLLRLTHCRSTHMGNRNVAGCTMSHTDLNAFTILPAPTKEGLQIWYEDRNDSRNSGWVQLDAPSDRFAYIVNFADQVDITTGGYLRSTPHRVVSPIGEDRYSIILFVGFQRNTELATSKLISPFENSPSRFEVEASHRLPGQLLTAENYTDLRKLDIGLISPEEGRKSGMVSLEQVRYHEGER